MKLVIAEKPSVGTSIAAILGAKERHEGYMEGNGYLVSWCVGHLCDFVNADAYDEKYAKWRYDDLPIIPYPWRYQPDEKKSKQLDLLKKLFAREDVDEVINACDAGREGERIFRSAYYFAECKKPVCFVCINVTDLFFFRNNSALFCLVVDDLGFVAAEFSKIYSVCQHLAYCRCFPPI